MTSSSNDNWVRRIIVSDPRKHKKGFTIYKVTSIVFPKASPEAASRVIVWKRYNDFKKLHHELQYKHTKLYLQDKFPPFVKARFFGRFEDEVIEERRKCATLLLEFIGDHPPLFTSSVFVKFFESGYTIEESSEPDPVDQPMIPVPMTLDNGNYTDSKTVDNHVPSMCDERSFADTATKRNGSDGDGPLLKLGGTWQFPQVPDSISLSSHSSDEHTTFTDTDSALSGVSSPLQSTDLQLFDPLQQSLVSNEVFLPRVSNSWLLSVPNTSPSGVVEDRSTSLLHHTDTPSLDAENETVVKNSNGAPILRQGITEHGNVELPAEMFLSVQIDDFTKLNDKSKDLEAQAAYSKAFLTPYPLPPPSVPDGHCQGVNYISKADYLAGQALEQEANGAYNTAFALYKASIACLLSGVQGDTDMKRKRIVREKTARYLLEAEKIYNEHLAAKSTDSFRWNAPVSQLSRPLSELKAYKVLGIINKVMLVLNVLEDHCYVIKVLHKSPCPVSQNKHSIIPQNVPYMVPMSHYFETDSSVFLVLHHASGGRLWDHVSSYFQSLPSTPVHAVTRENVYLGKKLIPDENKKTGSGSPTLSTVDGEPVNECIDISALADSNSSHDHSYVELIRDYTSAKYESSLLVSNQESGSVDSEKNLLQNLNRPTEKTVETVDAPTSAITNDTYWKNDSETEVLSTPERMEGGSNCLPDSVDICNQNTVLNDLPNWNGVPDLLPQSTSYCFSWRNLEGVDTADLLENAQRLIQSVSETLLKTDTDVKNDSTVKHGSANDVYSVGIDLKESNDRNFFSEVPALEDLEETFKSSHKSSVVKSETTTTTSKSIVRCKSDDDSSSNRSKARERRRSTGRRCSITARPSIERRFSSDDLFEGRARTTSGSLDRGYQWTRLHSVFDRPKPHLPESTVRQWAAELLVCVDSLHCWGIICRDLRPENVLLGEKGNLMLTYMCKWSDVDSLVGTEAVKLLYTAPEVSTIFDLTPAADWWSFGALVFELVTGKLLRHNPQERLGSGINGIEELKSHPFFKGIDWQTVMNYGTTS